MPLCVAAGCKTAQSDETLVRIDAPEVATRIAGKSSAGTILVDSRPREQFLDGHIPGAVNLRLEDVAAGRTSGLERFSTIIVYGENPGSTTAPALAKRLTSLGYSGVRLFEGGVDAWRRAGQPLNHSSDTPLLNH